MLPNIGGDPKPKPLGWPLIAGLPNPPVGVAPNPVLATPKPVLAELKWTKNYLETNININYNG